MSSPFALANFAPADVRFNLSKHGERVFVVDGDPDTADVARMLAVEERIASSEGEADIVAATEDGKQLLLKLIQDRDDTVTEIKCGLQELMVIFSLVMRGESVAAAVAERILAPASASGESAESGEPGEGDEATGAAVTPLRPETPSEKSSPEPSSDSADELVSLSATGTA